MVRLKEFRKCTFEGCENVHQAKGLCDTHYVQFIRHGKVHAIRKFRFVQIDEINKKQLCMRCEEWLDFNCFGERKGRNGQRHGACNRCKTYERYNITARDYDEMLKKQNYQCACCDISSKEKLLHIDHDHNCCKQGKSCGKCIRALLCNDCNAAIGHLKENLETTKKVYNYLEKIKNGNL